MDIYQALKKDHQQVKKLFDELEQSPRLQRKSRQKLVINLKSVLAVHSQAEEAVFYTPLRHHEEMERNIEYAVQEHHTYARTLEVLEDIDMASEEWLKQVTQLKEDVQHHIQQEENVFLKKAQCIFSWQQAVKMGEQFENAKNQIALKMP